VFKTGIAYINGGPLVRRGTPTDAERLLVCLRSLVSEYVQDRQMILRVNASLGPPGWNETQNDLFGGVDFVPSASGKSYRTIIVDINRDLSDIRKSFSHHWRTNLNNAEKMGLHIRMGTGLEMFKDFSGLYAQLLDRKQFTVDLNPEFYAGVQRELKGTEQFLVSLAEFKGNPVGGYISSMLGDTCVLLLGAGSQQGLDLRSSYLLQWFTLQEARTRSCRWYDLGGIDPEGNPGVYRFKKGMSGIEVTAPGPFEILPAGVNRYIAAGGERIYRAFRKVVMGGGG
jgi:lipid II:glycine glycyltransferase (peptidoglycan interpeptide bridge formation enzyme)